MTRTYLKIKVIPNARSAGIVGWLDDVLKVRVTAAPEHGKANAAVCAVLAEALDLGLDAVQIVAGQSTPRKVVEVVGLAEILVRQRLPAKR